MAPKPSPVVTALADLTRDTGKAYEDTLNLRDQVIAEEHARGVTQAALCKATGLSTARINTIVSRGGQQAKP